MAVILTCIGSGDIQGQSPARGGELVAARQGEKKGKQGKDNKDAEYVAAFLRTLPDTLPRFTQIDTRSTRDAVRCVMHLGTLHPHSGVEKSLDDQLMKMRKDIETLREEAKKDNVLAKLVPIQERMLRLAEMRRKSIHQNRQFALAESSRLMEHLYENHDVREAFFEGIMPEEEAFCDGAVKKLSVAALTRSKIEALLKKEKRTGGEEIAIRTMKQEVDTWNTEWGKYDPDTRELLEFYAPMTAGGKIQMKAGETTRLHKAATVLADRFLKTGKKDPVEWQKVVQDDREDFALEQALKSRQRIIPIIFGSGHDFSDNIGRLNRNALKKSSHTRVTPSSALGLPF